MKRLTLNLFILAGLMFMTSCSSDDDSSSDSVELDGTWRLTAWNTGEAFDLNNDGVASTNLLDEIDCYDNETLTFSNGVVTIISTTYADISVEIGEEGEDDVTYFVECEDEDSSDVGTYTRSGNTVTIVETYFEDGEEFEDVFVGTVDGDELSFLVLEGFVILGDDFEVEVEQDLTIVYTKQ